MLVRPLPQRSYGRAGWGPRGLALRLASVTAGLAGVVTQSGVALAQPAPVAPAAPEAPPKSGAQLPRLKKYVDPVYPEEAKKKGIAGNVTLELSIDKAGVVKNAAVIEGVGDGPEAKAVADAAVAAAKQLEFEPARKADGTAVGARILYRFSFTLKTDDTPPDGPPGPDVKQPEKKPTLALRGTVLTSEGDIAVVGASVRVRGVGETADASASTTDDGGVFRVPPVSTGRYQITISAPGFQPLTLEEDLSEGEALEVKYRLVAEGDGIEVTVRGQKPPREVTKRTVTQREIGRIAGTNGDALRALQFLPGVARPPGLAGLLLVRGSAPQDTQTFVDGTFVPLIYHFGGFSSVFPTEMLEKIDFYPGNFSAQYGRVQGGVVDVALRSPKNDGYHGFLEIDLTEANAMLEGPIPGTGKKWTFAAAGRRSYLEATLGNVLSAFAAGVTQAPVYYDYQFLVEGRPTSKQKFRAGFFGSDDGLQLLLADASPGEPALTGNLGFSTAFMRLQMRYEAELSADTTFRTVIAGGRDNVSFGFGSLFFRLETQSLTNRIELSHKLTKGVTVNVGTDLFATRFNVRTRLPAAPPPGTPPNGPFSLRPTVETSTQGGRYQPAAYAEFELVPSSRARVVPGVRLDYDNLIKGFTFDPRINARYALVEAPRKTSIKGGVGVFSQPPQPQESTPPVGTPTLQSNRSIHYSLGVEQELTRAIEVSLEGFYKQLDNVVTARTGVSATGGGYDNGGKGYVVGGELLAKWKDDGKFFGWLAYTLSRSVRVDFPGAPERQVPFDQTHILTLLGSYRLGGGWEFGATFRLVSGNLVTPNVCNPQEPSCPQSRTNALYLASTGTYTAIPFSGPASERLPLFHTLSLRVDKRWKFKSWSAAAYLDVYNVYNNQNTEGISYNYDFTARTFVSGLPIIPNLGLRGEF